MSATSQPGSMTTEELFRQHAPFVARFLARLGVPVEQAEDALQEVFLVVHRNGGYRPGAAKPTSYLASIAIHAAAKHRRRERADRLRHSGASPEHVASEGADPTRALQTQQELERLQLALERLPDELRTTLVLVEIEGESCLSIAAALGWPVGTVYWRLHEARKKLQLALRSIDVARAQRRAVASQPAPPEERRAPRVPILGMIMPFGSDSWLQRSDSGQLLRLVREQPSTLGATEALLARHRELVQAGADLPGWAASCVPHAGPWFSLIGLGGAGSIAALAIGVVASALLLIAPRPQPAAAIARIMPPAAVAPSSAVSTGVQGQPNALPAREPRSAAATISVPQAAAARPAIGAHASNATSHVPAQPSRREPNAARATTDPISATEAEAPEHPAPASPVATARAEDSTADSLLETREIANAERLLGTAPARALAIARSVEARFPDGYLREERAYVEVMALFALGRSDEARNEAAAFLKRYPDGPYSRRVHSAAAGARH